MPSAISRPWYLDVRFWIVLLFIFRLYHIDMAPLDAHSWRQTITLGVARNYLEWDSNFFHPRTLLCDSRTGIQAQEFPVFNYLIFLGWKVFGQENWVFRIINLLATSLGLWWFYGIVLRMLNHRAALTAVVLFGCSIAFVYGRKGMPDVFAVSLALGGVYYGWKFLEKQNWQNGLLFFVLATLGMLSKIPAAAVLALLAYPVFSKNYSLRQKGMLVGIGAVGLSMLVLWYFVWVPWAEKTYGHLLFYPKTLSEGWQEICGAVQATLDRFEFIAMQNKFAFYTCLLGLLTAFFRKEQRLLVLTWAAYSLVFFYFILKAGYVFSSHEYYVIPYIPMMAIFGGFAVDHWLPDKNWLTALALVVYASAGIYFQLDDFEIPEDQKPLLRLEALCDKYIEKDARILTSTHDGSPQMLYFCHRKGWSDDERWKDEEWLAGEATVGMAYVVVERFRHDKPLSLPLVYEDADYLIYKNVQRE